jgi:hypothetical protein
MKWFRKLLLPALNRPSTATLISSCPTDARALASRPESAEISYRAATSCRQVQGSCSGESNSTCADRSLESEKWAVAFVSGWMSSVSQNHSSSQVGAIIPETGSRRLMAGSITNGLNQIIACFQGCPGYLAISRSR